MASIFPTLSRRNDFFDKLRALLDEFPEFTKHIVDGWKEEFGGDTLAKLEDIEEGYPPFDEQSPVMLHGLVLVAAWRNLDGYEELIVIDPFEQSYYLTQGLLDRAYNLQADM